jgi:hypothetical protein
MVARGSRRHAWGQSGTMITGLSGLALLTTGELVLCLSGLASAQLFVYPERGQSAQQLEPDRGQCYGWAVQQTGFDPATARVTTAPPPPAQQVVGSGAMARGAVGGAAAGALFGGMRRANQIQQEQQMYENQLAQQQANFERAFTACMVGRSYTVR